MRIILFVSFFVFVLSGCGAAQKVTPNESRVLNAGAEWSLPITKQELVERLTYLVERLDTDYLKAPLGFNNTESRSCPVTRGSDETIKYWHAPRAWWMLAYLAEGFRQGERILKSDSTQQALVTKLRESYIRIADHFLNAANSIEFHDYMFFNPISGRRNDTALGWNNLASSWDAFTNSTCSSKNAPNVWASGWGMYTLATAFEVTKETRFLDGFYRAAAFWHQVRDNDVYNSGRYADRREIEKRLSRFGSYKIKGMYTVTGALKGRPPLPDNEQIIRYHYYYDDPARFAINTNGLMGMAMVRAGRGYPTGTFSVYSAEGRFVRRTWTNLGDKATELVFQNLDAGNLSYYDFFDVSYKNNSYENHLDFSAFYLAKTGMFLQKHGYVDAARRALVTALSQGNLSYYGVCLNRELDPRLQEKCKWWFANFEPTFRQTADYIFMATSALGL